MPYGHGKLLDVYRPDRPGPPPIVLLWHGVGPDERDVLEPLARATAGDGLVVVVPDWRSDAADGGGAHLLASLAFTREQAAALGGLGEEAIVLAGWSRGGRCAAAIGVRPGGVDGWRPMAVACLGAAYTRPAPTTGTSPLADLAAAGAAPVPFWIVHGTRTPWCLSSRRGSSPRCGGNGWPVRFEEPPTDHAGVIGPSTTRPGGAAARPRRPPPWRPASSAPGCWPRRPATAPKAWRRRARVWRRGAAVAARAG